MFGFLSIVKMFSGPIGQFITNGLTIASTGFVAWQIKQGVPADAATVIASSLVGIAATAINVATGAQVVKIQTVNEAQNGVRVVKTTEAKAAGISPAQHPLPIP